jgi:uncharacterized protein
MLKFIRVLGLITLGGYVGTSQAAAFDCQKAVTLVEKAICQDNALSDLDEELGAVFKAAMDRSKDPQALKKQQLNWLQNNRNLCQTNACLEKSYRERIAVLSNTTVSAPVETAVYVRYDEKGKPDYHSASLTLYTLENGKVKIVGTSTWVGDVATGNVNTGQVNGIATLQGDQARYKDVTGCEFIVLVGQDALTVYNDNGQCGGMNVVFNGYYKRIN